MHTSHASHPGSMTASQRNATQIRFRGRWLVLARVVWVSLVLVLLGLFVILLPPYFALLQSICTTSSCALIQPAPQSVQVLRQLGLSLASYAVISLALVIAAMLVCLSVGVVIFLRKSDEWMALLASFFMIPFGMLYMTDVFQEISSSWRLLAILLNIFCNSVFFLMGSLFPSGHFALRWSRWLVLVWVLWGIVFAALRDMPSLYMVHRLVWLVLVLCVIAAQLYRYRSVSSFIERQQTKWVVFAGSITALVLVGLTVPGLIVPAFRQAGSL